MSREGGYQASLGWTRTILLELELKKLCVSLLTVTFHLLVLRIWGRSAQSGPLSHLARNYREKPPHGNQRLGQNEAADPWVFKNEALRVVFELWLIWNLPLESDKSYLLLPPGLQQRAPSSTTVTGYNIWYTVTVGHWVKRMHRPERLKAEVQSGQTVGTERLLPSTRVLFNNFKGDLLLWETKLKIN